jgi:pyruvate-formate lyase-activating enzyme/diadenosine tetraphosphatase ApaH/serine/threonine PP2A family protein phosphatase
MRIGLCGGPYGNPYALRAYVADARARGCERLFCLGDLGGFGAEMEPLWPILAEHGVECIAGNYDVALARGDEDCGCGYTDERDNASAQRIYDHTRAATSTGFAAWMGTLTIEHREHIGGVDLHLVHGSPLALSDFWWESLPEEQHRLRAAASGADVICATHSGLPWQALIGGSLVINVGVIGKPANDGRPETCYAVLDLADREATAELVALSYDHAAQAASMRTAGMPEELAETIETGYWSTCIEILPPVERSRGRYQLYRSSLPDQPAPRGPGERPIVPLFGSDYFPARLWVYANFHCNLACDYCAVASSPRAEPRTLPVQRFRSLLDEACAEGFTECYLTGGEPFLHPQITDLISDAAERLSTVVLTNAMLLTGRRGQGLATLAGRANLVLQTSLDGAYAETHDAHRGRGSFTRTLAGIRHAVALGLPLRVAMTETPENTGEIPEMAGLLDRLGVGEESFAVRPLVARGFSTGGMEITEASIVPELTVTAEGLYWHPAGADRESSPDMRLADADTPLWRAKQLVTERFLASRQRGGTLPAPYHCAV